MHIRRIFHLFEYNEKKYKCTKTFLSRVRQAYEQDGGLVRYVSVKTQTDRFTSVERTSEMRNNQFEKNLQFNLFFIFLFSITGNFPIISYR